MVAAVSGFGATSAFFPVLGVKAYLGRTFVADEEKGDQSNVVVISHGLWQRLFGGDRAVIGQALILENVPRTIVGVLPRDFRFLQDADFFTPLDAPASVRKVRGVRFLQVRAAEARRVIGTGADGHGWYRSALGTGPREFQ